MDVRLNHPVRLDRGTDRLRINDVWCLPVDGFLRGPLRSPLAPRLSQSCCCHNSLHH